MTTTTPGAADFAVDLRGVRKTYGKMVHALRGIDVQARRGEIFGLLGPNGAGKSTLVKIMMTVVRPDAAAGTVLGRPIGDKSAKARMGYLPEAHRFPPYLTGRQVLDYFAELAGVPRAARHARAGELLLRVSMAEWAGTKISKYSKGMLQRLGIAQALMNDPDLVVLDEPTDGLDPIGRRDVKVLLQELRSQGKTIFLNSHLLSELEQVCDRVIILANGSVARTGTLAELAGSSTEYRIAVEGDLAPLSAEIAGLGGDIHGMTVIVHGSDRAKSNAMIDFLRSRGCLIESVTPARWSLEDVFMQTVKGSVAGGTPGAFPVQDSISN